MVQSLLLILLDFNLQDIAEYKNNIRSLEKYESYEWWYERSFSAPEERKNVYLVFEGVDCVAEYFLNGVKLGESENMFIAHEFKIDEFLKDGENSRKL